MMMPRIMVAHNVPYVATACPSYPFDLLQKVQKARNTQGPSYLHILSVCPTGWRCATELAVRYGRLAVQTGVFPLYEVENGKYRLTFDAEPLRPIKDYLKGQGRFRHLTEDVVSNIQARITAEWEALKAMAK